MIAIGVLVTAIVLLGVYLIQLHKPAPTGEQLTRRFSEFKTQYQEKKAEGCAVSDAERLAKEAKEAYMKGDYKLADVLLGKAFSTLEKAGKPPTTTVAGPTTTTTTTTTISTECGNGICESGEDGFNCPEDCCVSGDGKCPAGCTSVDDDDCKTGELSQIKVAVVYQSIMDPQRSIEEITDLLLGAKTDFVFRADYKYSSNQGYGMDDVWIEHFGKPRYELLADRISYLKSEKPNIIIQGAITCSHFDPDDTWVDGTPLSEDDVNDMCLLIDGECVEYYDIGKGLLAADIANPKWRDFVIDWSKKMIDTGVDAMFYDEPFVAARYKAKSPNEVETLIKTYEEVYWKDIVDRVKSYATSRDKTIYITVNQKYNSVIEYHPWKYTDIVTIHFAKSETLSFRDLEGWKITEDWALLKGKVIESHGKLVPIMVFIDWGPDPKMQLALFSELSQEDQIEFLRMIDESTRENGILFAYPIHGGDITEEGTEPNSRYRNKYDSVEEGTYDTIVELSKKRK